MACQRMNFGDGTFGIICTRGEKKWHHCESCGSPKATIQCDYPVRRHVGPKPESGEWPTKAGTCDRWQCAKCATQVGPDAHYCRPHFEMGPPKL